VDQHKVDVGAAADEWVALNDGAHQVDSCQPLAFSSFGGLATAQLNQPFAGDDQAIASPSSGS
jgi:hypothetical protein